jgi:hypothetical protein
LLIVPTINDPDECLKRLEGREKKDDAIFESLEFQLKFKPRYESGWFKSLFGDNGTRVVYIDAGVSVEFTASESLRMYKEFFRI